MYTYTANNNNNNNNCSGALLIGGTPTATGSAQFDVSVTDNNGGSAGPVTYTITVGTSLPVTLPSPNPSSLGPAITGLTYSGAINAGGGSGGGNYAFTVNDTTIPTDGSVTTFGGSDGLTATNTGGNTLMISGTPTSATTVTLNVGVTDTLGNTSASNTYTITVGSGPTGANNANLNGHYACLIQGFNDNDSSRWASVASLVADGSGTITSGEFDQNGSSQPSAQSGTLTGTYAINADNNGLATITPNSGTPNSGTPSVWAIALTNAANPAQQFRMVENDSSGQHGVGNCFLATTSAFASSTISGNSFALGMGGANSSGGASGSIAKAKPDSGVTVAGSTTAKQAVARFSASGGNITGGIIDMVKAGCTTPEEDTFTGTYSSVDANGKLTLTLTPTQQSAANCPSNSNPTFIPKANAAPKPESGGNGPQTATLAVYIIDSKRMFILETTSGDGLLAGNVRTQQNTPYTGASINNHAVVYMQGFEINNNQPVIKNQILQASGSGTGTITVNASYGDKGGTFQSGESNGGPITLTFDSSNPGRVTFTPGNNGGAYLYLFGTDNAFEMDYDGNGGFDAGWVEPQTQTTFSDATVAGTYMVGQFPPSSPDSNSNVGEVTMDSSGNFNAQLSQGGENGLTFDQTMDLTYAFDSTTYGTFLVMTTARAAWHVP